MKSPLFSGRTGPSLPTPGGLVRPVYAAPYGRETDAWITGFCMLRCNRVELPVTYVGDVSMDGGHMALFSCAECMAEMRQLLKMWARVRDGHCHPNAFYHLNDYIIAVRRRENS